jgi:hypothetical protein
MSIPADCRQTCREDFALGIEIVNENQCQIITRLTYCDYPLFKVITPDQDISIPEKTGIIHPTQGRDAVFASI